MICQFEVAGTIVPWARPGQSKQGCRYTPQRPRDYGKVLREAASSAMGDAVPADRPVELFIVARYLWPKHFSAKRRMEPSAVFKMTKPDADNLLKIVKDALNKIVYVDDARCAVEHVAKIYDDYQSLRVAVRDVDLYTWPLSVLE
ncbi:MAG: RusA family crossover junction endodeoxyribonuclease [Alphaproteobacteria bacterium]|nr:RusA family crossover junction endodeoxyribonuclease [Alphaproteobacteria bacterium]